MKSIVFLLTSALAAFFIVGCGGGGADDVVEDAKKILLDKTLYECRESESGDKYTKNSYSSDKLLVIAYKVSDDSEVFRYEVNISYDRNNLYLDADGGINCKISDKGSYIETICNDGITTKTSKLYNSQDEAITNCVPSES